MSSKQKTTACWGSVTEAVGGRSPIPKASDELGNVDLETKTSTYLSYLCDSKFGLFLVYSVGCASGIPTPVG